MESETTALLEERLARPALLDLDPEIERRLEEARRRAWARPMWVCITDFGAGNVCGKTFWGERPQHCPRCGKTF